MHMLLHSKGLRSTAQIRFFEVSILFSSMLVHDLLGRSDLRMDVQAPEAGPMLITSYHLGTLQLTSVQYSAGKVEEGATIEVTCANKFYNPSLSSNCL